MLSLKRSKNSIRIISICLAACLLCACRDSPRLLAERLAEDYAAEIVGDSSSLRSLGRIQLDSAFIDFAYLPETQEQLSRLHRLSEENQSIYADLQKPQYSEIVFNMLKQQLWDTGTQVEELHEKLRKAEAAYDGKTKGWMSAYRFRTIEDDGYVRSYHHILYYDSAITRITAFIDLNDSLPVYRIIKKAQ